MGISYDLFIMNGQKTVTAAGTAEKLATGSLDTLRVRCISIKAKTANGGKVYVGDQAVSSTTGRTLDPGEVIEFAVSDKEWEEGYAINLSKIFLDVDTAGEGVSYIALRD